MRRTNWKTVSTLVTMVVIAGCQDNAISAPQSASVAPASIMLAPEGRPQLSLSGSAPSNTSADFSVGPSGGTFLVGNNVVVFPPRSICDPAKSSYGPGTWDRPCEPSNAQIKIHAEVRTAKAGTWVDFTPALRFVPSTNSAKWVWIVMYAPTVVGATDLSKFGIFYAPTIGATGTDETASDPTSRTYVDTHAGLTYRRIKHFSGWWNSSGRACDPATESDCYPSNSTSDLSHP
jgi:hypothetical protein